MTSVTELDLPQIDIFDPEYSRDPHAAYIEARKHHWLVKYQFGYLIVDYDDQKAFYRDDDRLRTPGPDIVKLWQAEGTAFDRFTTNSMVAHSGDKHKRLRDLVAPAFTPRNANRHREFMKARMHEVLDKYLPLGQCDFAELSAEYPITVMCRLIGVPGEDVQKFADWLEPQESAYGMDASMLPVLNETLQNMYEYVTDLVNQRRVPGDHPDDLLQDLVELAEVDGDQLTDEELKTLLILLLGGGYDTTKNQMNIMLKQLMDMPDELKKLKSDPERLKPFINESLRYQNAIGANHRVTNEDIEYKGVLFPAKTFISLPTTHYGRDESKVESPETFDPERKQVPTLAFGQGIHLCLGQFLARALLEEGLPIIIERMKNFRLNGEIEYRSPLGIWGYKSLPIRFDS